MISVKMTYPKDIAKDKLDKYEDMVIKGVARITLDYTNSKNRFPRLTGALQEASVAGGVKQIAPKVYGLGTDGSVDYAKYVWGFPQKGTHWTNPQTYTKWYATEFKNEHELIMRQAINNAHRNIK